MTTVSFIIKSHLACDADSLIGGASKNPYRTLKYLAQITNVRRVIYFDGSHSGSESYVASRFQVRLLRLYVKTLFQNLYSACAVWSAFRASDIVQCHHPHYGLAAAIFRKFFFPRVRFIVKAHGTALPELRANRYSGVRGLISSMNAMLHLVHDRFVLAQADVVLCSSQFQLREMVSTYGIDTSRLQCIYNGFDPEYLSAAAGQTQGLGRLFIFCGRVVPKKGARHAIRLFARLAKPEDRMVLILGRRAEVEDRRTYTELQRVVASDARVAIVHDLSEAQLYEYFTQGTVGIVSSVNYESIPTVVIEMLAAGLPVFATYSWGIPEILPANFGLSGEFETDVQRIGNFLALASRPTGPTERIRSEFNYRVLVKEYIALYERLMAANAPASQRV